MRLPGCFSKAKPEAPPRRGREATATYKPQRETQHDRRRKKSADETVFREDG